MTLSPTQESNSDHYTIKWYWRKIHHRKERMVKQHIARNIDKVKQRLHQHVDNKQKLVEARLKQKHPPPKTGRIMKPYSAACDNNKHPILQVIQPHLAQAQQVLEIGSGTGQHAVYFAAHMPHLIWQCSDVREHHEGINLWVQEAGLTNLRAPLALDVLTDPWPDLTPDAIFTANTTHIMSWPAVEAMFQGVAKHLTAEGLFLQYGPFHYHGQATSDSNAHFDQILRQRDPNSGIRDIDDLQALAGQHHLSLLQDIEMPANNRLLIWQK